MTHHARPPVIEPAGRPAIALAVVPAAVAAVTRRPRVALGLLAVPVAVAAFFRDPARRVDTVCFPRRDP